MWDTSVGVGEVFLNFNFMGLSSWNLKLTWRSETSVYKRYKLKSAKKTEKEKQDLFSPQR